MQIRMRLNFVARLIFRPSGSRKMENWKSVIGTCVQIDLKVLQDQKC